MNGLVRRRRTSPRMEQQRQSSERLPAGEARDWLSFRGPVPTTRAVRFHGLLTPAQGACETLIIQTSRLHSCVVSRFHGGRGTVGGQASGCRWTLGQRRRSGKDKAAEGPGLTMPLAQGIQLPREPWAPGSRSAARSSALLTVRLSLCCLPSRAKEGQDFLQPTRIL